MGLTYFKRFRMEIKLAGSSLPECPLPPGYRLYAWDAALVSAHAEAKYHSFRFEVDANVFPCLASLSGCNRLMKEIAGKRGFLPEATWLAAYVDPRGRDPEYCGTIQGIVDQGGVGSIQNVGITPFHRGCGLGTALLVASLEGFRAAGVRRVSLEVTSQNEGAIRLYKRLGFRKVRTVYKSAKMPYAYAN